MAPSVIPQRDREREMRYLSVCVRTYFVCVQCKRWINRIQCLDGTLLIIIQGVVLIPLDKVQQFSDSLASQRNSVWHRFNNFHHVK